MAAQSGWAGDRPPWVRHATLWTTIPIDNTDNGGPSCHTLPGMSSVRTGTSRNRRTAPGRPPIPVQPVVLATATTIIAAAIYLAAPRMGADLAAMVGRADFARSHPFAPVDFRWAAGTPAFATSVVVPWLAAEVGTRLLGAIAAVVGTALAGVLLGRARHPVGGALVAAITQVGNLAAGRVNVSVGMAVALVVLLLASRRRGAAASVLLVGAALAGAAAAAAGLFLVVVGAARYLHRRDSGSAAVIAGATFGVAALVWLGNMVAAGSPVPFGGAGGADANGLLLAGLGLLLLALMTPRQLPAVRTAALLAAALIGLAAIAPQTFGALPAAAITAAGLAGAPVAAAVVDWPGWRALTAVCLIILAQPPVAIGVVTAAGSAATNGHYFAAVITAINQRAPLSGRVEIPPISGRWEVSYAAHDLPLSRGAAGTADEGQQFDAGVASADRYRAFLLATATQYVAVPDAALTAAGRREAELITGGLAFLRPVWRSQHWLLYGVSDPVMVVASPGSNPRLGPAQLAFEAPRNTVVRVNVRWSPWLRLVSQDPTGCIADDRGLVAVHTGQGGRYVVTSALIGTGRHC